MNKDSQNSSGLDIIDGSGIETEERLTTVTGESIRETNSLEDENQEMFVPDSGVAGSIPITDNVNNNEIPKEKKSMKKIIIRSIIGVLALMFVIIMIGALFSSPENNQENNEMTQKQIENEVPTLDNAMQNENKIASDVMVNKEIIAEQKASDIATLPTQESVDVENKNNLMENKELNINEKISTEDMPIKENVKKQEIPLLEKEDTINNKQALDNNVKKEDASNINENQSTSDIDNSSKNTNNSNNLNKNIYQSNDVQELRNEAKRLIEKADMLESSSKLDNELLNKSPEEQIVYLKEKISQLEKTIKNIKLIKEEGSFKNNKQKNKNTQKITNVKMSNYNVVGLVYGQVWINYKGSVKPYVIGDKLPSGAIIKDIDYENKTIDTSNGKIKVNA